jgi:hypothetical protein
LVSCTASDFSVYTKFETHPITRFPIVAVGYVVDSEDREYESFGFGHAGFARREDAKVIFPDFSQCEWLSGIFAGQMDAREGFPVGEHPAFVATGHLNFVS